MQNLLDRLTPHALIFRTCALVLIVTLFATGCRRRVEVRPAEPLPPPVLVIPRAVTDPVTLPSWLRSPERTSTSSGTTSND